MDDGVTPRLLMVSHCLLNPYSQVKGRRTAKQSAQFAISRALQAGVGLLQLPCPEFTFEGPNRWAKVREQYDTVFFREHSQRLMEPLFDQLQEYLEDGSRLLGVLGVDGSPSCGAYHVSVGEGWGGCYDKPAPEAPWIPPPTAKILGRGVFLQVVAEGLEARGWSVPVLGVLPDNAPAAELETFRGAIELMFSEEGLEAFEAGEEESGQEDPWERGDLEDWV